MATPASPAPDVFLPCGRLCFDLLTETAAQALRDAIRFARETRWDSVRSPHLFMGLLAVSDQGISNWGERLGADLDKLLRQFQELFYQPEGDPEPFLHLTREFFSDNVIHRLRDAHQRARDHQRSRISCMDILISLLTATNSIVAECFERIGVTAAKLTELAVIAEQHARQP